LSTANWNKKEPGVAEQTNFSGAQTGLGSANGGKTWDRRLILKIKQEECTLGGGLTMFHELEERGMDMGTGTGVRDPGRPWEAEPAGTE